MDTGKSCLIYSFGIYFFRAVKLWLFPKESRIVWVELLLCRIIRTSVTPKIEGVLNVEAEIGSGITVIKKERKKK